jgi:hypothetical protein
MKEYRFKATIEAGLGGGAAVAFPYDVLKEFGTRASIPVKATFDGVPYTGSLTNCGLPHHVLGVLKAIRKQIGKDAGDTIEVVVWRDDSVRTVELSPEFEKLLEQERLLAGFRKLSYTHQKEYVRWITEAKKAETQQKRMAKAVTMLKSGTKTPG